MFIGEMLMDRLALIAIKRIAMETAFFCAEPYDCDYGFDRLMACRTTEDLNSAAFGDIFLHAFLQKHKVDKIKKFVLDMAIQPVTIIEHVLPEIAEKQLLQIEANDTQKMKV